MIINLTFKNLKIYRHSFGYFIDVASIYVWNYCKKTCYSFGYFIDVASIYGWNYCKKHAIQPPNMGMR